MDFQEVICQFPITEPFYRELYRELLYIAVIHDINPFIRKLLKTILKCYYLGNYTVY